MLRRKLMLILVTLAAMLMVLAVAALWSLQRVFVDMDNLRTAAMAVDHTSELNTRLSTVQVELYALQTGRQQHLDQLVDEIEAMNAVAVELGSHHSIKQPEIYPTYQQYMADMKEFESLVGILATANDRELSLQYNMACLDRAAQMHYELLEISRHVQAHSRDEQSILTGQFRWLVVAIALGFMVVINTSILMMLRAAGMVLRPIGRLVHASRELAKENFEHRVVIGQSDEFDELAQAYNSLAEQLQENERRRIQTLQQTALTLNHELNNAITTIDLQLTLLRRRSGPDEALQKGLGQIQENLHRMSGVIASLKQLKRVVLTDYVDGVKMLDLQESTREDGPESSAGR